MNLSRTLIAASCLLSSSTQGQTSLPQDVIMGTVAKTTGTGINGYHCETIPGLASFERGASATGIGLSDAVIGTPGISLLNPTTGNVNYSGVILLTFAKPSFGTASFDYNQSASTVKLPSGDSVPFTGYTQSWIPSSAILKVAFKLQLNNCVLPVQALFRAPRYLQSLPKGSQSG